MASTAAYDELDRVRKALKHARIKRDRVPKADHEARRRAEEKVATLEQRRDELYERLGRRTAGKLEDAQTDHASGADLVRRGLNMALTGLSRMEGANKDTLAAALEQVSGAAGSSESPASSDTAAANSSESPAAASIPQGLSPEDQRMSDDQLDLPRELPATRKRKSHELDNPPGEHTGPTYRGKFGARDACEFAFNRGALGEDLLRYLQSDPELPKSREEAVSRFFWAQGTDKAKALSETDKIQIMGHTRGEFRGKNNATDSLPTPPCPAAWERSCGLG